MKKAGKILALALTLFSLCPVQAQRVYSVGDVPNTKLTDASSWVSDPGDVLSPQTVAQVNGMLGALQRATSVEVAVVVLSSIGEQTPEDFAIALLRKWGIGQRGRDNGMLILLVTDDRLVRFEVGYGLEGVMTDAVSKRIQTLRMMPYLKAGDWDNAVLEAVKGVDEYLTDPQSDLHGGAGEPDETSLLWPLLIVFGGMILMSIAASAAERRRRRCPRCGATMRVTGTTSTPTGRGTRQVTTTLTCPQCGYTTTWTSSENVGRSIAGGVLGGLMGGSIGRGFGGGFGGGGGSWGGGSSGGGGATSRF